MGSAIARRALRRQRYEAGLCVICGEPRRTPAQTCTWCNTRNTDAHRRYMQKRAEALTAARRAVIPRPLNYATDDLIVQWMPLVYKYAHRVRVRIPESVLFDDLVAAGMLGLVEAGRLFDVERCVPFSAWVRKRIRGRMFDEARKWLGGKTRPQFEPLALSWQERQPMRWATWQ